jgi:hypothetical protein
MVCLLTRDQAAIQLILETRSVDPSMNNFKVADAWFDRYGAIVVDRALAAALPAKEQEASTQRRPLKIVVQHLCLATTQ